MRGLTSHVDWDAKIWETENEEKVNRVPVGRKNIGSIFSLRSRWKQLTCSITQKRVMRMSDMVIDGWIGKQDKRAPNLWGGTAGSNGIGSRSLNGCLPSAPVRLAAQRQPPGQTQHNVEAERCCRSQRAIPPQKLGNPGARALGAAGWLGTADRRRVGGAAQRNSRPLGRGDQQWGWGTARAPRGRTAARPAVAPRGGSRCWRGPAPQPGRCLPVNSVRETTRSRALAWLKGR